MEEETTQSQRPVLIRVSYTTLGKLNGMHLPSAGMKNKATISTTDPEEVFRLEMMIGIKETMIDMNEEEVRIMEDNQPRPT